MPISHIGLFMAMMLINHVALARIATNNALVDNTHSHPFLYNALLTGLTLIISIALLQGFDDYVQVFPVLNVLDHFMYLLVMAFVAHLVCVLCFKLKPSRLIPALFPVVYLNSIGLGVLIPKINIGLAAPITTLIVVIVFTMTSVIFYFGNLGFNTITASRKLSVTLLMTCVFALLFFGLIAFY